MKVLDDGREFDRGARWGIYNIQCLYLDFLKSSERSQAEEVTRDQLHVYAVGYRELTGNCADLIEVLNLDQNGRDNREVVEDPLLDEVRERVRQAGEALRENHLPRHESWCRACDRCDLVGLCRDRPH